MSVISKIEWTESTWNPVTGCRKISAACQNCYAERFANRFRGVPGHPYEQGFCIRLWPSRLDLPLRWRRPRSVFVNSMSDLFLNEVPFRFIEKVYSTMNCASWHTYQVLTKRPERLLRWADTHLRRDPRFQIPQHIWVGVSVENNDYLKRIEILKQVPATIRFVSFEPLIGPVRVKQQALEGIHWIIVGGETGPRARPMNRSWVDAIYQACRNSGVPFFFKHWGMFNHHGIRVGRLKAGRKYLDREWNQTPVIPVHSGPLFFPHQDLLTS
jgi:protein gp37